MTAVIQALDIRLQRIHKCKTSSRRQPTRWKVPLVRQGSPGLEDPFPQDRRCWTAHGRGPRVERNHERDLSRHVPSLPTEGRVSLLKAPCGFSKSTGRAWPLGRHHHRRHPLAPRAHPIRDGTRRALAPASDQDRPLCRSSRSVVDERCGRPHRRDDILDGAAHHGGVLRLGDKVVMGGSGHDSVLTVGRQSSHLVLSRHPCRVTTATGRQNDEWRRPPEPMELPGLACRPVGGAELVEPAAQVAARG